MGPTEPTTAAERLVIRWLFGVAFVATTLFIAWSWYARVRECAAICDDRGLDGSLHLNPGSRLNIGTYCSCKATSRSGSDTSK